MKYLIFYSNGNLEHVQNLLDLHTHLIKIGVINFIVNIDDKKAIIRNNKNELAEASIPEYS